MNRVEAMPRVTSRLLLGRPIAALAVLGLTAGCQDHQGPPVCSEAGRKLLADHGAPPALWRKICEPRGAAHADLAENAEEIDRSPSRHTDLAVASAPPPPTETHLPPPPPPWPVPPTPVYEVTADPAAYLDKLVLLHVRLSPSAYYNYGYGDARDSHFSFSLKNLDEESHLRDFHGLQAYADKVRFRTFFNEVLRLLRQSRQEDVEATVLVTYLPSRYDRKTADSAEIVKAAVGRATYLGRALLPPAPPPPLERAAGAGWQASFKLRGRQGARAVVGRLRALGDRLRIEVAGDPITTLVDTRWEEAWDFDPSNPSYRVALRKFEEPILQQSVACAASVERCLEGATLLEPAETIAGHSCRVYQQEGVELAGRAVTRKAWRPVDLPVPFLRTEVDTVVTELTEVQVGAQDPALFELPAGFQVRDASGFASPLAAPAAPADKAFYGACLNSARRRLVGR